MVFFFFFKQKTAYEMRISDWSSDVCSSDLVTNTADGHIVGERAAVALSSGGTIDNAGLLTGDTMGVLIQNGVSESPVSGSIINSGTITGNLGGGIVVFGLLEGFAVANSGAIAGAVGDGVYVNTFGQEVVVIDNEADATDRK